MHKQLLTILAVAFCGSGIFSLPLTANAQTSLTRATVRDLRNKVELFLKEQKPRLAKKTDNLTPGDSLQTYPKAMAELRFNDNSLARIGEQAIFRFIPNTRNLSLQKGTVLLLIPPGQGRTQVKTPNAVAGIRGSALFVRYIEDTEVTIVGALTDSAIEISNGDGTQTYVLKAGQLGTVHKNQIGIYDFDLKAFYETSPLVKDINMEGLEAVGQEMAAPRKIQVFASSKSESVLESPPWMLAAENRPGALPAIATPSTTQPSLISSDLTKNVYEWSSILATLKQYSNPAQPFQFANITTPPVPTSLPVHSVFVEPPLQVAPPTVSPPRPIPDAVAPPQVAPPTVSPPRPIPDAATPPPQVTPPTIVPPAIAPPRPLPTSITPPAPPAPAAIQPPTPPAIAPVVVPAQTAIISTPPVAVPIAAPVVPAIPPTTAIPATPTTPAVPAAPATPAAVVAAPSLTPNFDLPSVQPSGVTTTAPPNPNVNPVPSTR